MSDEVVLICNRKGYFADDVPATCAQCGVEIVHRPHAPADSIKICVSCGVRSIKERKEMGVPLKFGVSNETVRELDFLTKKPKGSA